MKESKLYDVWEVYPENYLGCLIFLTKEQAENQKQFVNIDFIAPAKVYLNEKDLEDIEKDGFIWG